MNSSEKMLDLMRRMGGMDNQYIKKAEMISSAQCKVGNLVLEREDYLKPENVNLQKGDTVIIYKLTDDQYVILEKVV